MLLRRLERWLHQHLFKVGWLATKNLQTTTILYYTFFLPGVVLHEFVYWLVAGLLDVRAERSIRFPEAQAIGELRLNFVRLPRNTGNIKTAIISLAPLVAGLAAVWHIANNVLNVPQFLAVIGANGLATLGDDLRLLTATPDFWLWVYVTFTISNTMMPNFSELKGMRVIAGILGVMLVVILALGLGNTLVADAQAPLMQGVRALAGTFAVMIAVDLVFVAALGAIEAIIERITGDSATFKDGKMITMRREEIQKLREQERLKRERQQQSRRELPSGPPSIYKLPLPIPEFGAKDALAERETVIVQREDRAALASGAGSEGRAGAALVTGAVVSRPEPTREKIEAESGKEAKAELPDAPQETGDKTDDDDYDDGITYEDAEEPA